MKRIIFILGLLAITYFVNSEDWKYQFEMNSIKVWTKKSENSSFNEYKGLGIVDAKIWTVIALMDDLESYPLWNGNCIHAEIIIPRNGDTMFQYFVNSAPWPMKGRDVILKTVQKVNVEKMGDDYNENIKIDVNIEGINDELVPLKKDYVRIKELRGSWIFKGLKNGKTEITYTISTDLSGKIPESISNMVSKNIPYKTIINIREMVKKEKYITQGEKYIQSLKK